MAFDNQVNEVYDLNLSCTSDDDNIDGLYHELYNSQIN